MNNIRLALLFLVDFVFGVIEFLIGLRFVFKLFGASSQSQFVSWVYDNSKGLIHPFEGAFPTPVLTSGFIIEFSSLLALLIYGVIAFFLIEMLSRPIKTGSKQGE